MKPIILIIGAVLAVVSATPRPKSPNPSYPAWSPAGKDDGTRLDLQICMPAVTINNHAVRSPCPLLNTLANHNYLPHSGKNITIAMLVTAFPTYVNIGTDIAQGVGAAALAISGRDNFSLDELDKHGAIEHDGSLASGDAYFGNDHSYNPFIYGETKSYFTEEYVDVPAAAKARLARVTTSNLTNPEFDLTAARMGASFTETGFYLSVMGDAVEGVAKREWVNIFFGTYSSFSGALD